MSELKRVVTETCGNCKHFEKIDYEALGDCYCDKFVYDAFKYEFHDYMEECEYDDEVIKKMENAKIYTENKDILNYWDSESCDAGFRVGENFGCIHWDGKDERI